jgi:hypothetical protein
MESDFISAHDRREIAGALYDLGNGAHRVSQLSHDRPATGSPLAKLLKDSVPSEGWGQPGATEESVRKGVMKPIIAGFDHYDAYASGLRSDRGLVMSLATVTRGALEAWGRAWWLLESRDATELQCRRHALTLAELKYQIQGDPGGRFSYPNDDGVQEWISGDEYQDKLRASLSHLDSDFSIKAPSYTALATEFLKSFDETNARWLYSQLSSAAHGETMSTTSFSREVEHDPDDSVSYHPDMYRARFGLPHELGIGYAMALAAAITVVTDRTIEWWGMTAEESERWAEHRWRAGLRLDPIDRA